MNISKGPTVRGSWGTTPREDTGLGTGGLAYSTVASYPLNPALG